MKVVGPALPLYSMLASSSSFSLSGSGHKGAFIFQVPKNGTIDKLSFYQSLLSGTHTYSVGLYTVDSSGNPTTTAYGGMAPGTIAASGATTVRTVALPTAATATAGDVVACVISFSSYGGSGSVAIFDTLNSVGATLFPYRAFYDGATWTRTSQERICLGIFYSDGTAPFTPGFDSAIPLQGTNLSTQKAGNRFVPSDNCSIHGILADMSVASTDTYSYFIEKYDISSRLQEHQFLGNQVAVPGGVGRFFLPFVPSVDLTGNTEYAIAVEVVSGSSNWIRQLYTGEDTDFVWFEQSADSQTYSNIIRTSPPWTTTDHDYTCFYPVLSPR